MGGLQNGLSRCCYSKKPEGQEIQHPHQINKSFLGEAKDESVLTKKVFWAANSYWDSPFQVGAQHLARQFLRNGWKVFFFSDPVSPFHFLSPPARAAAWDRLRTWKAGGRQDASGRLLWYSPLALVTPHSQPLLRSKWVLDHWHHTCFPGLSSLVSRFDCSQVDLMVVDTVSATVWPRYVHAEKIVFRVTDNLEGFSKVTPWMKRREQAFMADADLVTYSASAMAPLLEDTSCRQLMHLPNGVDFEHFRTGSVEPPPEYKKIKAPIALYVGAMDAWFDYGLLERAASVRPDYSFVLIGPPDIARKRLAPRPNIHLLGVRPFSDLPRYMRYADVGIILFDAKGHERLVNYINPLKLYEYMACGLPVVSVRWLELERLASPALLYDEPEEFLRALDRILQDGEECSPQQRQGRVDFAASHSWASRYRLLVDGLGLGP